MRERLRLIRLLRRYGIEYPIITYQEAKRAGVELAVLAAVLEQETGGGRNVFGHDPTIFVGAGKVTKGKYLRYLKARGPKGKGGMQGVGPMQLTWYTYQDAADKEGGCWKPRLNIRVGAGILAAQIKRYGDTEKGLYQTFRVYNGSGSYAESVLVKVSKWRKRLHKPLVPRPYIEPVQKFDSLHPSLHAAYSEGRRRKFTDLGTYVNKSNSDHAGHPAGHAPAWAFDLGARDRFFFKGWGYLRARRLAKWYVKHHVELNIEYVILGRRIWSRTHGWHAYTRDSSHDFHIHVSGHDPNDL